MNITFEGRNYSGYVEYGGIVFPCGETVSVKVGDEPGELSQGWVDRLSNHPEFTVTGKAEKQAAAPEGLGEARKAYKATFGKNAGPKWTVDEIEAKLAAKAADDQ